MLYKVIMKEELTVDRHYDGELHIIDGHESGTLAVHNVYELIKKLHDSSPEIRTVMQEVCNGEPHKSGRIRSYYSPSSAPTNDNTVSFRWVKGPNGGIQTLE